MDNWGRHLWQRTVGRRPLGGGGGGWGVVGVLGPAESPPPPGVGLVVLSTKKDDSVHEKTPSTQYLAWSCDSGPFSVLRRASYERPPAPARLVLRIPIYFQPDPGTHCVCAARAPQGVGSGGGGGVTVMVGMNPRTTPPAPCPPPLPSQPPPSATEHPLPSNGGLSLSVACR